MLDDLFANRLYPTGIDFKMWSGYPGYPSADGTVLLIPARYWAGHEAEISAAIAKYSWLLVILTSDEESTFDASALRHPNLRLWIQTPRVDRNYPEARFIGVGYTPHMRRLPVEPPTKNLDVFLSAQRTHKRRVQAFDALGHQSNSRVEATAGFTQGMDPVEYVGCMVGAKVAPAPSGAVSPDSFRFWEALEAHAVPIADDISPSYDSAGFWSMLLPDCPAPLLRDYADLSEIIGQVLDDWPAHANHVIAWWMRYKRQMSRWLRDDLTDLGAL